MTQNAHKGSLPQLIAANVATNQAMHEALLLGVHAGSFDGHTEERELSAEEKRLGLFLQCSVPMWVQRFADRRWTLEEVMARGRELADAIASDDSACVVDPDRIGKRGSASSAFNAIAESVACLSFCPGGITFVGAHFESEPEWLARSA